ncbi:MAG: hypothetical protein MHM6MM_008427 [Cercozoa sp. M6MM]
MNNAVRGARRMASSEPFRFSGFSNFRQQYSAGGAASSDNSGSGSSSSSSSNGGSGGSSSSYNTVGGNGGNTFDESFNQNEFARSQSTGVLTCVVAGVFLTCVCLLSCGRLWAASLT